jgi:hypothetical protein
LTFLTQWAYGPEIKTEPAMSKSEALIAAVRARREAAGLNVKLVDGRDGHVTQVSCASPEKLADLKRRAAKAEFYKIEVSA